MACANSADPDPFSAEGAVLSVYTVCYSTKYVKKQLHKKQNLGWKSMK